ncbi:hypothetical protein H072_7460 [Dactylellina haptotyla CBS 200.50]|uniref:Uncharacterized protein n=1 Tax=Dactylellina haptotyla (strain CBS 200.50) TaxID=1284197 RepID=S8A7H1_DACHA|nr:hypothetical protein H072_7460 [Dactylellina haptotyla CBS 200.50]
MEYSSRRPALPSLLNHQRRSSVPRLSIIVKDSRFPDAKHIISPISPNSPRGRSKNIATAVVVMSPRLFSPAKTPTRILSPASSRRGSEESTASRRASRTSVTMGSTRRRESIIYRNEQEYDSAATAAVERQVSSEDTPMDEDFPSTKSSVAPMVTKVRAYSIATLKSRRRTTRSSMGMQEQATTIVAGQRRRSSIVVVHNCSPASSANREFSEMPEESEDEA